MQARPKASLSAVKKVNEEMGAKGYSVISVRSAVQIQLSRHLPKVGAIGEVSGGSYLLSREGNPVLGRLGDKHAEEGCRHR